MNLQKFISENRMDETKAVNLLQRHGVISDNVVQLNEIARTDEARAMEFLKKYLPKNQGT